MHYIIGCGSVAPDIIPTLCLLKTSQQITLIDSETIETTIADPEILAPQGNGLSKAQGLANHFGCRWKADGFKGKSTFQRHDWLICLADDQPTRLEVLNNCDAKGCHALVATNEQYSNEVFYYRRAWRGTRRDPRIYYQEIVGCRRAFGRVRMVQSKPPSASLMLALHTLYLFVIWNLKTRPMEGILGLPYKIIFTDKQKS